MSKSRNKKEEYCVWSGPIFVLAKGAQRDLLREGLWGAEEEEEEKQEEQGGQVTHRVWHDSKCIL